MEQFVTNNNNGVKPLRLSRLLFGITRGLGVRQRTHDNNNDGKPKNVRRWGGRQICKHGTVGKFFEGLSNGTRRDRKTVTRCLIRCCTQHPPPLDETDDNAAVTDFPMLVPMQIILTTIRAGNNNGDNPSFTSSSCSKATSRI
mmetsp:Transcript_3364/g.5972  ORF Transcript_3364/g.5972 Transcript_3364/m.5972 type:complete len:143 (-) Transcript_3364:118-546(-)